MNVVWFKRDLRIHDNKALTFAAQEGPVIPLYILEPELWQQPDMSSRQYQFLKDCLLELDTSLTILGQRLIIKVGKAVEVFDQLKKDFDIQQVWSHQETWNHWTYQRDLVLKEWFSKHQIIWHEPSQNGVIRRLKDRDGWAARWYKSMREDTVIPPAALDGVNIESDPFPSSLELKLKSDSCVSNVKGGRREAIRILDSFLHQRGQGYTKEMSSPVTAYESCSRLSPHIAFGTISIKEVFQAIFNRR